MKTRFLLLLALIACIFDSNAQIWDDARYVGKDYALVTYVISESYGLGLSGERYELDEDEHYFFLHVTRTWEKVKTVAIFDKESNICGLELRYEMFDQNIFDKYYNYYESKEVEKTNLVNEFGFKVYKTTVTDAPHKYFSLSKLKNDDGTYHSILTMYYLDESWISSGE